MLKKVIIFSCVIVVLSLLWKSGLKDFMHSVEMLTYDWRTKMAVDGGSFSLGETFRTADDNIIIVSADNNTFDKLSKYPQLGLGRWPWPRKTWAEVIEYIEQGNPKAVILDLSFEGVEGYSEKEKLSDKKFADTLKKYDNITIGLPLTNKRKDILDLNKDKLKYLSRKQIDESIAKNFQSEFNPIKTGINITYLTPLAETIYNNTVYYNHAPVPSEFLENANYGSINVDDMDGSVIRYNIPFYRVIKDDNVVNVPSLALAAVLNMEKVKDVNFYNNSYIWNNKKIPVDSYGRVLINWHGDKETYKTISLIDLFFGRAIMNKQLKVNEGIFPQTFKDKIVVIGQSATGTDIQSTPFGSYPGPEINATLIDNYINDTNLIDLSRRKFVKKAGWMENYLVILILCILVGYCNIKNKSYMVNITLFFSILAGFILGSLYLFSIPWFRLWINMTYATLFIIVTSLATFLYRVTDEQKNKKNIIDVFGKFVSPQILNNILKDTRTLNTTNTRKFMTVMFADIKGFTSIAESISPDVLIEQLNIFFDEMVEIVLKNNGTIDKFIGDAMMAFWGDPIPLDDHALLAVKTAIEMREAAQRINLAHYGSEIPPFNICVGINSGDMIVGYMGSSKIVDYTVIGDNVNVASRIEGLNRQYDTGILVSESTYELIKDQISAKYLDEVLVKGKSLPIKIYEVIGLKE